MNSLKTVMVVTVMAVVAYGVYATLTKAPRDAEDRESLGPAVELPADPTMAATGDPGTSDTGAAPRFVPATTAEPAPRFGSAAEIEPALPAASDSTFSSPAVSLPEATTEYPDLEPPPLDPGYAVAEDPQALMASASLPAGNPAATGNPDFQAAMQQVRQLLDQELLADALRALSAWYDERQLSPIEQAEMLKLLDQLAGTVIYSREHWLAAAHVVQAGETLPRIAERYNVPWQLLAKINGISNPNQLRPGESLKVVPGPFHAVIDARQFRLTLFVDNCYAGRFQIGIVGEQATPAGRYEVQDKLTNPPYFSPDGRQIAADDPNNPLGEFWIDLGNNGVAVGIHGTVDPQSIGSVTADGSVRLAAKDIPHVFDILSIGSSVSIRR